jgi:hypothetical protein
MKRSRENVLEEPGKKDGKWGKRGQAKWKCKWTEETSPNENGNGRIRSAPKEA